MLSTFLGSSRALNLLDLLPQCTAGYETWTMHHTSFFNEATLIEIGVSWYMTIVRHGCLCYSMLSFCLEHGWSWYIMVHDYGLTWLSMLFHVLPCHGWSCYIVVSFSPDQPWKIIVCCSLTISILDHNWPWLNAVIVSIVFTFFFFFFFYLHKALIPTYI